ncbi:U8 snoRNA-decapping enzyme [Pelomyxa schiedti]|nr:U8 snoRNA-decapping enzyme [Pelomyxa schiedti]
MATVPAENNYTQGSRPTDAAHCAIYYVTESHQPIVLMLLRFDGQFGFAGGFVDEGETVRQAVVREIQEELGFTVEPERPKLISTETTPNLTLHFFACEITKEQMINLESHSHSAKHWGIEVLGIVRVPTFDCEYDVIKHIPGLCMRNFFRNKFVSNSRDQLVDIVTKVDTTHAAAIRALVSSL